MRVFRLDERTNLAVNVFFVVYIFLVNIAEERNITYDYALTCGSTKRRAIGREDIDALDGFESS
jgi:hypothetical protein|tara:strand:+ start:1708 stop:1899 length:192 start_codon:yes stop_codon:yes gene_type:complete